MNSLVKFFQTNPSLKASIASAVAATASVVVAYLAYKVAKLSTNSQVLPMLKVQYGFGERKLGLTNVGKGPALKIRLQRSQFHNLANNRIINFKISSDQSLTLYDGETKAFEIVPDKPFVDDDIGNNLKDLNLFRFIETIGKSRAIGIIFSNVYGKNFLLEFKMLELNNRSYVADLLSIKSYGFVYAIRDYLSAHSYRMLRYPRWWKQLISDKIKGKHEK